MIWWPRNGRNTIAIHKKPKNTSVTTLLRVFSSEPEQRENHKSSAAPSPPFHHTKKKLLHRHTLRVCKCASFQQNLWKTTFILTHVPIVAVEAQCRRLQLRTGGEQFRSTPTAPTATPPNQDAPQCTGESRSVREDVHTLAQSVSLTTAWDNTVPNFDLAPATTIENLQSTNSSERLFGSKSSARQLTTKIPHQMFGKLFTRANSAHAEQPYQ